MSINKTVVKRGKHRVVAAMLCACMLLTSIISTAPIQRVQADLEELGGGYGGSTGVGEGSWSQSVYGWRIYLMYRLASNRGLSGDIFPGTFPSDLLYNISTSMGGYKRLNGDTQANTVVDHSAIRHDPVDIVPRPVAASDSSIYQNYDEILGYVQGKEGVTINYDGVSIVNGLAVGLKYCAPKGTVDNNYGGSYKAWYEEQIARLLTVDADGKNAEGDKVRVTNGKVDDSVITFLIMEPIIATYTHGMNSSLEMTDGFSGPIYGSAIEVYREIQGKNEEAANNEENHWYTGGWYWKITHLNSLNLLMQSNDIAWTGVGTRTPLVEAATYANGVKQVSNGYGVIAFRVTETETQAPPKEIGDDPVDNINYNSEGIPTGGTSEDGVTTVKVYETSGGELIETRISTGMASIANISNEGKYVVTDWKTSSFPPKGITAGEPPTGTNRHVW